MAIGPSGRFAYQRDFDNVSAYTINATSGSLKQVKGSPFATGIAPEGVASDPTGRFAYVANVGASSGGGDVVLSDIRRALKASQSDRLYTDALLEKLWSFLESPWPTWHHGKPRTPRGLAKLLRPYGIHSKQMVVTRPPASVCWSSVIPSRAYLSTRVDRGQMDYTGRFTYWCRRFLRGGRVLAPEPASRFIQFSDAADIARFAERALASNIVGIFNVVGPAAATTMRQRSMNARWSRRNSEPSRRRSHGPPASAFWSMACRSGQSCRFGWSIRNMRACSK